MDTLNLTHEADAIERLNTYAVGLQKRGIYYSAAIALKRALAIDPTNAKVLGNLGGVLWHFAHREDAAEHLRVALEHVPDDEGMLTNYGLVLAALGDHATGLREIDRALEINPKNHWARWNRALTRFKAGDWDGGFVDYECRMEYNPEKYPRMPFPFWNGEDLTDKTLVVVEEQGLGDRILFSRYVYWLKQRWPSCRIWFMAQPGMQNLLWHFKVNEICDFIVDGAPWPKADYGAYQITLAKHYGTQADNVPSDPGYILNRCSIDKGSVNQDLFKTPLPTLRVGIAWTGNPDNITNGDRSIPLEFLLELAENPHVTLYGLQVGPGEDDLQRLDAGNLCFGLGHALKKKGMVGTGEVMLNLDLVVTICTSVAHLAGALNVPCWTLLCDDPYWVWGDKPTTPWYPTMTLFRQTTVADWRPVIDEVKLRLDDLTVQKLSLAA